MHPTPWLLDCDLILATLGAVCLMGWAYRVRKRRLAFRTVPWAERPNTLAPVMIFIPLFFYVFISAFFAQLNQWWFPSSETPTASPVIIGGLAQLLTGLVCLVLVSQTFTDRWRGFFLGIHSSAHATLDFASMPAQRDQFPDSGSLFISDSKCSLGNLLRWGVGGFLVGWFLCWTSGLLSVWVIQLLNPEYSVPDHPLLQSLAQSGVSPGMVLTLWISAVIVAPLAEEIFFRGVLQTGLNNLAHRPVFSIVIVSILFGFSHGGPQPHAVVPMFLLAVVLGYSYERTGALFAPILIHVLFNLKTMLYSLYSIPSGT